MLPIEIQRLELSPAEQSELAFLQALEFPRDYALFMILPFPLIKKWLYLLDPKLAIVITCDPEFKKLFGFKQTEGTVGRLLDWVIRRVRGFDI